MKNFKSIITISALFVIGSANAKVMKQNQPMISEASIDAYITDLLNDHYPQLENVVIKNYNEQDACQLINNLGQTISNKYPNNLDAQRFFITQMDTLFNQVTNVQNRTRLQNCAKKAMGMSNIVTTKTGNRNRRYGKYGDRI